MTGWRLAVGVSFAVIGLSPLLTARALAAGGATTLVLETEAVIEVGVHPSVTVRLTDADGPVADATILITLQGRQNTRVVTDADGRATAEVARDLSVGEYELRAIFRGTSELLPSQSRVETVRVTPATFRIRTVPPVPNLRLLKVGGLGPLITQTDGTIEIPISKVGRYELEIALEPGGANTRVAFDRWGDGSRRTSRSVRLPGIATLDVALEMSYLTSIRFVDSTGATVDPGRIESLLIANSRGGTLPSPQIGPQWLPANKVVRREGALVSEPIEYRVQEVLIRGTNVVNRGQLHFQPDGENTTWVIPLLLYSLTVWGQDAIFGSPVGASIALEYPDGSVESVSLGAGATATIRALPRGNYRAVVEGAPGIPVSTPLVLSRDQQVRVPVISYLDIAFVPGAGLSVAVALVLFGGRPIGLLGRRLLRRAGAVLLVVVRALAGTAERTVRAGMRWVRERRTRMS